MKITLFSALIYLIYPITLSSQNIEPIKTEIENEISQTFENRKNKIIELTQNANDALKNVQIADALRYLYWSQILLRSYPSQNDIKISVLSNDSVQLINWIPLQINKIFSNLSVKIDSIETNDTCTVYMLGIRFNNQAVRNFDFTYLNGKVWSNINSAKDGLGVMELAKSQTSDSIRLKCEYVFEWKSVIDLELRDVMQKLPEIHYKNCYITIGTKSTDDKSKAVKKPSSRVASLDQKPANSVGSVQAITQVADKESIMKKVIAAISSKNYASVQPIFTTEGYSIFQALVQFGNARIIKLPELKYYQFGESVICRSIPMSFNFKSNNRTFVEDVVFCFDKNNQIENLTFGLAKKAVDDIASNDKWNENVRMQLINFMENYKTAFALKRLDYIEKIFSDDALIITGRVTTVSDKNSLYPNHYVVKSNKESKINYIQTLKNAFASNAYVNIDFTNSNIRKSSKSDSVYGIQIKQDFFTSFYGYSGYLFFMIGIENANAVRIYVSTCQKAKNADGSIYGLLDF